MLGVALTWAVDAAAQPPSTFVERHTAVGRTITRLRETTSPTERVSLAERLARLGPPERVALALAEALTTELEPPVRAALLTSATRVAALDPVAGSILGAVAIQRFGEARTREERAGWARLLGWVATGDAAAALLPHAAEPGVEDALVHARAIDTLLAALEAGDRAHVVPLLGRMGDHRAAEPLLALAVRDTDTLLALARIAAAHPDDTALRARVRGAIEGALVRSEDARELVAILDALAELGLDAAHPAPLERRLTDPEPSVARAALRCAHALEPAWAASFAATLPADDPRVASLLDVSDEPALVPHAVALAEADAMRDRAHDFLARVEDGAGIDALFALDAPALVIAVALRRAAIAGDARTIGWSSALRALAGARATFDASGSDRDRAEDAMGIALSSQAPDPELARWIEREPDRAVRAWLLEAARRHRVALDARWLRSTLTDDAEPALIAVVPFADGVSADRRALRRGLSRWLREGTPAQIAAASFALAEMEARDAAPAIEALLEHPQAVVRVAAAGALLRLVPERARYVRARAAIDPDPRVASLLAAPLAAAAATDVLFLDVHATDGSTPWLEVQTDDGLLRRLPVAPDGTFALIDVPGARAEVRLLLPE